MAEHSLSWWVCMSCRWCIPIEQHGFVIILKFTKLSFTDFHCGLSSPIPLWVIRWRCCVFETIVSRKIMILLADELWTVVCVTNCRYIESCEMIPCRIRSQELPTVYFTVRQFLSCPNSDRQSPSSFSRAVRTGLGWQVAMAISVEVRILLVPFVGRLSVFHTSSAYLTHIMYGTSHSRPEKYFFRHAYFGFCSEMIRVDTAKQFCVHGWRYECLETYVYNIIVLIVHPCSPKMVVGWDRDVPCR